MSLGATGFMEILRGKFEINYSGNSGMATQIPETKTGIFGKKVA